MLVPDSYDLSSHVPGTGRSLPEPNMNPSNTSYSVDDNGRDDPAMPPLEPLPPSYHSQVSDDDDDDDDDAGQRLADEMERMAFGYCLISLFSFSLTATSQH